MNNPPDGVYAIQTLIQGSPFQRVANSGVLLPVEADGGRALEVHILNFPSDLYIQQSLRDEAPLFIGL